MSGGVDSSVAAFLLLKQGYEVIGGFMKNWSDGDDTSECSWRAERRDAMRVAAKLNIPFYTFDFETDYRASVYEYMIREYEAGRTPNPDVLCNKYMKFGLFLKKADELGCDFIATGHYARIKRDAQGAHLFAGIDNSKDQSYFLCRLKQNQLTRSLFPVGELRKSEVRELAKKAELHVADKKDSQGICFVGKVALDTFLKKRIVPKRGDIIDKNGNKLGEHEGHMYYTIGQRHGLGLAGGPWYVAERRPQTNELVVVSADDPMLYSKSLLAVDIVETITGNLQRFIGRKIKARIRYRQPLQDCKIESWNDDQIIVVFKDPQKAVAPGQFIAFYHKDELLGSAVIQKSDHLDRFE